MDTLDAVRGGKVVPLPTIMPAKVAPRSTLYDLHEAAGPRVVATMVIVMESDMVAVLCEGALNDRYVIEAAPGENCRALVVDAVADVVRKVARESRDLLRVIV